MPISDAHIGKTSFESSRQFEKGENVRRKALSTTIRRRWKASGSGVGLLAVVQLNANETVHWIFDGCG